MKQIPFYVFILIFFLAAGGLLLWYGYRSAGATTVTASPSPTVSLPAAGTSMTVSGEVVCLPKKQKGDFQTLECAYGIRADSGQYYALSDPTMQHFSDLPTGQRATVRGTFQEPASDNIYDTVGTLVITEVVK